jgi:hypothetical protein
MNLCQSAVCRSRAVLHSLVARVGMLYYFAIIMVLVMLMVSTFIVIVFVINPFEIFFFCGNGKGNS